ncbi:MAG: hypothetical protein KC505_02975 [Myxococcales bacterium]|nr:hypothetical protein [Myxococcales bacterium]USN50527.1 MAG: hypothetical protein H6731_09730 [Myxococcales bacterium]
MADSKIILRLAVVVPAFLFFSCAKVPIEVTLENFISIHEDKVSEMTTKLLNRLKQAKLAEPDAPDSPGKVKKADCTKAFNKWLTGQFNHNLVPKRIITPSIYAKDNPNPLIKQCRDVNLDVKFSETAQQVALEYKDQNFTGTHYNLDNLREQLNSKKCSKNFIEPKNKKFSINSVNFKIENNTLNIPSPEYKIYISTRGIDDSELSAKNAEENLVTSGSIISFAQSKAIPPHFTGLWHATNAGNHNFDIVQEKLGLPDTDIIAIPGLLKVQDLIKEIDGSAYYIVPKGHLAFFIMVELSIHASLSDAMCALDEYKKEVKKEQEEQKKNFYKSKK